MNSQYILRNPWLFVALHRIAHHAHRTAHRAPAALDSFQWFSRFRWTIYLEFPGQIDGLALKTHWRIFKKPLNTSINTASKMNQKVRCVNSCVKWFGAPDAPFS